MRIKIRYRSPPPTPWKWEIYVGKRIVTASDESFTSQDDAHFAGRIALDRIVLEYAKVANRRDAKIK